MKISWVSIRFAILFCLIFFTAAYLIIFAGHINSILNLLLLGAALLITILAGGRFNLQIELPLGAFILVLAITTITSIDPHRSFYQTWLWICGFFVLYVSALLASKVIQPTAIADILLLIGAGFMAFSWLDALSWYRRWLEAYPGMWIPAISFRLNGGNTIAAYYHGIFMLALARLWFSKKPLARLLWAVYSLSVLLLLFLASSRGAFVGMIGAFGLLVLLRWRQVLAFIMEKLPTRRTHRIILFTTVGFILIAGVSGGAYWFFGVMSQHPTHGAALGSRAPFWDPAITAFLQSPLLGNGPDTYAGFYIAENSIPPGEIFLHAHNTFLDLLSGCGIFGLLAFGWLMVSIIMQLLKDIDTASDRAQMLRYAAILALLTFLGHSLFDGLYRMPFAAFNLCILVGAGLGTVVKKKKIPHIKKGWIPLVLGVLSIVMASTLLWSQAPYRKGITLRNESQTQAAIEQLEEAARRDPWFVLSYQQLGILYAQQAADGDTAALDKAFKAFEKTIALEPTYSVNHANLASLYKARGDLEKARTEMAQAQTLAPTWAVYTLNLGEIDELAGDDTLATEAYQQALELRPDWATDAFWQRTKLRQSLVETWSRNQPGSAVVSEVNELDIIRNSRPQPILSLASERLSAGDLEAASRLLAIADLVFNNNPEHRIEKDWLRAELAAAHENWESAAKLGEEVIARYLTWGAYGPGSQGLSLYASGVFHTEVLHEELVPQLTIISLPGDWDQHLASLAGWWVNAGEIDKCEETYARLIVLNPDYLQKQNELSLCE